MTGLLVSVRSLAEARDALAGGADLIDLKEPSRGALGPADPCIWREVIAEVNQRVPVSAALGELASEPIERLVLETAGLRFVKIGLAGCALANDWGLSWRKAVERLPAEVVAVPVAYADWHRALAPSLEEVLSLADQLPARMLLIDTHDKCGATLFDYLPWQELAEFAAAARDGNVRLVLAGSLRLADIERLLELEPAYIGVRGAACKGGRAGAIDPARVKSLAAVVRGMHSPTAV
jgi:(5-formylfuran-3-yl)methyl phosphate synthase